MNATLAAQPVTVSITRRVRPGREAEFEQVMASMRRVASQFAGHLGGFVVPPEPGETGRYQVLFAFDTEEHLRGWSESAQRRDHLERLAPLTQGETPMRLLSGMETWFALSAAQVKSPPPRWKMALTSWLGIFPLVLLLSNTFSPLLGRFLHPVLVVMAMTAVIVLAMTWLVMPTLVRLLAGWLYPPASREPA